MRILYVQPGRGIGGAKISLAHLLRNLVGKQASQVVLSPPEDPVYAQMIAGSIQTTHYLYLPGWQKQAHEGFKAKLGHTFFRLKSGWYLMPAITISRIIHREHIDLVHTNNSICPVGALAAYLTRRPHIWHVREPLGIHGQYPLSPGDERSARIMHQLSRIIICNSDYTAGFFRQYDVPAQVICNGIDLDEFGNSQNDAFRLRERLELRTDQLLVGMVGSLRADWKEHNNFLQMVSWLDKQLPECQFIIYGGSTDLEATPYTRSLRQMAERLGISQRIFWAGFVNDIPAMMKSLDVLVHPTSREGSGRVIMEAMAAGTPVVGIRAGGVKELIEDGVTGYLVTPGDVKSLVAVVKLLLEDPALRMRVGHAAKLHAFQHFSHESIAAAIHSIYREILDR